MKPIKDNFSRQAADYHKFRPVYPSALYDEILEQVPEKNIAWDCGTGNGQVANVLAKYFKEVKATDISEKQLKNAVPQKNVEYLKCRAEQTPFPENQFDLITVAQAIHWFDFNSFFKEVKRVGKKGGVLAVWGYGLLRISPEIDVLLDGFYKNIIGPYWDNERKLVDNHYRSISFPFIKININSSFSIDVHWGLEQFHGYLNTWSSVQNYLQKNANDPVETFINRMEGLWGHQEIKKIQFPLFLKLYRLEGFRVEKCSLHDYQILWKIAYETFAATFEHLNTPENFAEYVAGNLNESQIKKELSNPGSEFYFYYFENELAGYVKLNEDDARTEKEGVGALEIERIYLYQQFQGKGLGKKMLSHILDIAKTKNKERIWLGVWEENSAAIGFYEKMGFKIFGQHDFYLGKDKQVDLLMELILNN